MLSATKHIPGPGLFSFLKHVGDNPVVYFYQLMKQYGGVVRCRSLPDIYLVSCPVLAKQVLAGSQEHFDKSDIISTRMKKVMGEGLVVSNGRKWKRQRRTAQLVLGAAQLQQLAPRIERLVDETMESWHAVAGIQQSINASRELQQLVLRIMVDSFFSVQDRKTVQRLGKSLLAGKDYVSRPRPFALPAWVPLTRKSSLRKSLNNLDQIILGMMKERSSDKKYEGTLLAQIMDQPGENGQPLSAADTLAEVKNLFASSYFSIADLLVWLVSCLATHPEWADRIAVECGGGNDQSSNWMITQPDTAKFIHEVLRCYPPGWAVVRRTLEPVRAEQFIIPQHATVLISIYNLHHHPACWEQPELFDPHRFDRIKDIPGKALFVPFGLGPRKCAGMALSRMVIHMICAKVADRFCVRVKKTPAIRSGISLGTEEDLEIYIEQR